MSSRNDCRVNVAAGHGPSGKRGGVDERGLGTRETMPKKGIKIKELAKELGVTASLRWRDKAGRPASAASLERALSQCADAEGWSQADARGWWELHAQAIRGTRADPKQATDALLTVKLDER
ncbi:MAG: hypothetical protein IIB57_05745 [Planctomycetes bacterium]|nr:hypothetical protein [Planctomycetota bacterium]